MTNLLLTPGPGLTSDTALRGPAALFSLMTDQHGVASCAQARRCGVSRMVERRLRREGAVIEVLPGVLGAGGVPPTFIGRAMAATLRPGVVALSHGAAARLHRLAGFNEHDVLDVLGDKGSRLKLEAPVITHYTRGPIGEHITRVGTVPVTSIALTLTLIAPTVGRATLARALTEALRRGVAPQAISAVARAWGGHGRAGPGALLSVLDAYGPQHTAPAIPFPRTPAAPSPR